MIKKLISSILLLESALFSVGNLPLSVAAAETKGWSDPATIYHVDDSVLNTLIDARADGVTPSDVDGKKDVICRRETYKPADRYWEGLPSTVCVGNRIWSTWYTGGTGEPREFNYLVVAYSDDNGVNWVDPYLVIDHDNGGVSLGVPNLWIDGEDLCLSYIQYYTWVIRFHNPDAADINDVVIDEPIKLTQSKIHKNPTYLRDEDGSYVYVVASENEVGDSHVNSTRIYVSKDISNKPTDSWEKRATIITSIEPTSRVFPESQVVELDFGKWLLVSRLENGIGGGVETSISNDFGHTWEPYKNSLEEPFIGPGSKGHIMRLSSGHILMINHDNSAQRSSLFAYLSTDNGNSFPYKLSIDHRSDVSYPFAQEKNGKIYVSWDKGRYIEKEIRLSIITEEDIINGKIVSEGSKEKIIINKLNSNYFEIVSIVTNFESSMEFKVGTNSSDIRKLLPSIIVVKDENNKEYTLNGVWKSAGYKPSVAGKYVFTFDSDIPSNLSDTYQMLKIEINLVDDTANIGLIIGLSAAGVVLIGASVILVGILKRKKHATIS